MLLSALQGSTLLKRSSTYCSTSGKPEDLRKSSIFLNYDDLSISATQAIKRTFNCNMSDHDFGYLGAPIFKPKTTYQKILHTMENALAILQSKYISSPGWVTFGAVWLQGSGRK